MTAEYNPNLTPAQRKELEDRIGHFESAWFHGEKPAIEDYLSDEPILRRAMLAELVHIDLELRHKAAETISLEAYFSRFPELEANVSVVESLRQAFDNFRPRTSSANIGSDCISSPQPGVIPQNNSRSNDDSQIGEPTIIGPAANEERLELIRSQEFRMPLEHNLLFGVLALQNGFISRDQLVAAFGAWTADKSLSLDQILLRHGALDSAKQELLLALMTAHLSQHANDPHQSLAAFSSVEDARNALTQIPDPDVQASLLSLSPRSSVFRDPSSTSDNPQSPNESSKSRRFRVLRFHARGGLGEVHVAVDTELNREVALKEIQPQFAGDQVNRDRFLREAEITGGLEHPSIVPVYGLGTYADGRPYYAMKFIRGDSLADAITAYHKSPGAGSDKSLALRQLLQRFIDVCEAMQYAHDRGVLHRDLKPGNIMLGRYGETLIVDWGLAKPLGKNEDRSPEITLIPTSSGAGGTLPGSTIGTPAYMSPEQAAGHIDQLGPASDVYSLGATLYHILTGVPAFSGSAIDILGQVIAGTFKRPRERNAAIPKALEAICVKAMALKPIERFATASDLAEKVERWLAEASEEAIKLRRSLYFANMNLLQVAWENGHLARVHELLELTKPGEEHEDPRGFEWYFWNSVSHGEICTICGDNVSWMPISYGLVFEGDALLICLCSDYTIKSWDLAQLASINGLTTATDIPKCITVQKLHDGELEATNIISACLSYDGSHAAMLSVGTNKPLGNRIAVNLSVESRKYPEKRVDLAADFDATSAALVRHVSCSQSGKAAAFLFSHGSITVWRREPARATWLKAIFKTNNRSATPPSESAASWRALKFKTQRETTTLSLSPNGLVLASADAVGNMNVWNTTNGKLRFSHKHAARVNCLAFSTGGESLASGSWDRTVHLWDPITGHALQTLSGLQHEVSSVVFDPSGDLIAAGDSSGRVIVWKVKTGEQVREFIGHTEMVTQLAFNPSGTLLASSSTVVKIWSLVPRCQTEQSLPHNVDGRTSIRFGGLASFETKVQVTSVDFSSDGTVIASAGGDGQIRLWDAAQGTSIRLLKDRATAVLSICYSAVEETLASGGNDGMVTIWCARTGMKVRSFEAHLPTVTTVCFSPSGSHLVSAGIASDSHAAKLWDVSNGKLYCELKGHSKGVSGARFSPDGTTVATCSWDGLIKLWDLASGREVRSIPAMSGDIYACAFHPTKNVLATVGHDQTIRFWNVATGEQIQLLRGISDMGTCVAFSCDGNRIASGDYGGKVTVWDLSSGQEVLSLKAGVPIHCLAFSPKSGTLAAGLSDGTVKLWRWR